MTAHEVFTALLWLVLLGYLIFLGWFVMSSVGGWRTRQPRQRSPLHPAVRAQQIDDDLFEWGATNQDAEDTNRAA
ncbi:MAG: hypothetical protein ACR2N2_04155 [Acidimicrobiia bacterium]